jgi:hypothetical protein
MTSPFLSLIFDTGSSITWVNLDCSKALASRPQKKEECFKQPRYNPFTSQTSQIQGRSFNLTYGLGGVVGSYFTDDFKIGSAVANKATFGVAVTSRDTEAAILGAGGSRLEYPPKIIGTLAAQGHINSYAFSVDLKPLNQMSETSDSWMYSQWLIRSRLRHTRRYRHEEVQESGEGS